MSNPTICPIHRVDTALWEHSLPLEDHGPCFPAPSSASASVPTAYTHTGFEAGAL